MLLCVRARLSAPTPDSLHARAREAKIKFDELNKCGGKGGSEGGGKGGEGGNASGSEDEDDGASPPSAAEDATAKAAAEKAAAEKAAPSKRHAHASAGTPTRPTGSTSTKGGNGASPAMKKSATTRRAVEGGRAAPCPPKTRRTSIRQVKRRRRVCLRLRLPVRLLRRRRFRRVAVAAAAAPCLVACHLARSRLATIGLRIIGSGRIAPPSNLSWHD